jgi:hypothetical protein
VTQAFAYSVLSPDRARCLGCIYLERCDEVQGAQLAYWVIDDALRIEAEVVTTVLTWVHRGWGIQRILIPLREANPRGISLAKKSGLVALEPAKDGPLSDHHCFLSA